MSERTLQVNPADGGKEGKTVKSGHGSSDFSHDMYSQIYISNRLHTAMSITHAEKKGAAAASDKFKTVIGLKKQHAKTKLMVYLGVCIGAWSIVGMGFYRFAEGWSWSGAMFYATNVGLGVGYGVYNISTAGAKWFTIFYCLVGSSFVAGTAPVGAYIQHTTKLCCSVHCRRHGVICRHVLGPIRR
jgi:hypothetical protein